MNRNAYLEGGTAGLCGRSGGRKGFTLMEVMISAVLFAVIMLGAFGALKRGSDLVELSRDETRVTQILQSRLEDLRRENWAALIARPTTETFTPASKFVAAFGNKYTCTQTISSRATDQKEVVLVVSWAKGGVTYSREYRTWITKGGLSDYYYRSS